MDEMVATTSGPRWPERLVWVGGAVLAALVYVGSFAALRHERRQAQRVDAEKIAAALQTGLATPVESLHAVAGFLRALDPRGTSLKQFQAVAGTFVGRHPEIVALEWLPVVPSAERPRFEELMRQEIAGYQIREPTRAGDMVRAVERPVHVAIAYAEPANPAVSGLDIAFDPERMTPVWRALREGRVTLSNRYQLVEDPDGVYSVVAYAPVQRSTWRAGAGAPLQSGVVVGLFRIIPLFETALRDVDLRGVALEVRDAHAPASQRDLYRLGNADASTALHTRVRFIDRNYEVTIGTIPLAVGWSPALMSLIVVAGTLLLQGYWRAARRARRLERFVKLGQYTIEFEIGRGGMGTVYRGRHSLLRRPTALKIAHVPGDPGFQREALLTCSLNHPNTILIYDFGQGEDGTFYLAMEYVEGFDLEELMQEAGGPLPGARAARVLMQVAGSLAEAHERGIFHRDLKPRNVMVTERGGVRDFVKVLDFGLARRREPEPIAGDNLGAFEGTAGYAAPEVVRGAVADARSDIFSFGCVAYFLVAGRPAYPADASVADTLTQVLTNAPPPLPAAVEPALAMLIVSCLQKRPHDRPDSMLTVAARLRGALGACPPWSQQDAEDWWRAHPARRSPRPHEHPPRRQFSVVLPDRNTSGPPRPRAVLQSAADQKAHGSS